MNRAQLYNLGVERMKVFCDLNGLPVPTCENSARADWIVGACAYYREDGIRICTDACAWPGTAGRAWSWPGYVIDRTPYGVIQHELGHHVDFLKAIKRRGAYYSDFSIELRERTGEPPITSYAPNDGEWFAEIMRLFITNPNLLQCLRPKTFEAIRAELAPAVDGKWEEVLEGWHAPGRTIDMARKKVSEIRQ